MGNGIRKSLLKVYEHPRIPFARKMVNFWSNKSSSSPPQDVGPEAPVDNLVPPTKRPSRFDGFEINDESTPVADVATEKKAKRKNRFRLRKKKNAKESTV